MNKGFVYRDALPGRAHGKPLLDWLEKEHPHSTREEWLENLKQGRLTLDDAPGRGDEVLRAGQVLVWSRPPWVEPEVPLHFQIIHHDAHVLVVNKPSGLSTMPGGGFLEHTLLARVRAEYGPDWSPMHRLGRGTSGLVAFATPHAAPAMQSAFRDRELEKRYLARVTGTLLPQTIDAPIGLVPFAKLGELHAISPTGRPSQTIVEAVTADRLATVRIITGRPHQIRIHLAHVGHPLEGDPLYGANGALLDAVPSDLGYWLHAWQLKFRHPVTGQMLALEAERLAD